MTNYIIYHGADLDGFSSAWVVARATKNYKLVPETHRFYETIELLKLDLSNSTIYFTDICPEQELFECVLAKSKNVIVLDHHRSIEPLAIKYPDNIHLDIAHSAVWVAWNYFYPENSPPPLLVQYISDNDIWQHKLPCTKAIYLALNCELRTVENFEKILAQISFRGIDYLAEIGNCMFKYQQHIVNELKQQSFLRQYKYQSLVLPTINTPTLQTEVLNELSKTHPAALSYSLVPVNKEKELYRVSLRSDRNNLNYIEVDKFALQYDGGGHKHAAGFYIEHIEDLWV